MKNDNPSELIPTQEEDALNALSSYTKYVVEYGKRKGFSNILDNSNISMKANVIEMELEELLQYCETFSNEVMQFAKENNALGYPLTFNDFLQYKQGDIETDPQVSIETQQFFNNIASIQERESRSNKLKGDNPSIFVFLKYDHRKNLFTYAGEVDRDNPSIIHGVEGINSIFDIPERMETAFIIKKGYHGLLECREGNYNELLDAPTIKELQDFVSDGVDPTYPCFLEIGLDESKFGNYACTRNMCKEFLDPDAKDLASLKLVELDIEDARTLLDAGNDAKVFCDAKDNNTIYMQDEEELYRYNASLETLDSTFTKQSISAFLNSGNRVKLDRAYEVVPEGFTEYDPEPTVKPSSSTPSTNPTSAPKPQPRLL